MDQLQASIDDVDPDQGQYYSCHPSSAQQRTFFKAAINNSDVLEITMEHYSEHRALVSRTISHY